VTVTGPAGTVRSLTSARGRYLFNGLRSGEYRVGFSACAQRGRYVEQWYGGALTASGARPVLVASGHPTLLRPVTLRPANAMAYLAASARAFGSRNHPAAGARPAVSGTVTDSHGKRLAGICVNAFTADGDNGPMVRTARNGTYRFRGGQLRPGRWEVFFSVGCGNKGNFAPQWWKFAATVNKAKVLVVHSNSHFTGIDARLGKGASISGTVRAGSKSGPALPGACVTAFGVSGNPGQLVETRTGRGGKYLITGLGTGRYDVGVRSRLRKQGQLR